MNENLRLTIKIVLAKNFIGTDGKILAARGRQAVKGILRGQGICKNDIAEARKELHIRSEKIDEEYWWVWENEQDPKTVWERLNRVFWRQADERKRD